MKEQKRIYKLRNIFREVGFYLLMLFILIGVFFAKNSSGGAPTSIGGFSIMQVLTGSMETEIPKGSLIVTHWTEPEQLKVGDDITYMISSSTTITHRIVEIREDYAGTGERAFITQGICNPSPDAGPVAAVNVVGKVIFHSYVLGQILGFAQDHWMFVVILLVLFLALFHAIRVLVQANQEIKQEEKETGAGKKAGKSLLITVLFLGVLGSVSGTYAWNSISQEATNPFYADAEDVPVKLLKLEKQKDGTLTEIPLSGAKFYLYQKDGKQIGGSYTTDELGKISLRLPAGEYYFTEVSPKEGYTFDVDEKGEQKKTYPFTVKAEDEAVIVTVYNIPKTGMFTVEKWVENADGSELRGEQLEQSFTFKVIFSDGGTYRYRIDGGELQSVASGGTIELKHGQKAAFENLPVGVTYTITEETVEHYWVKADGHRGTVTEEGGKAIFTNIYDEEVEKVPVKIYVTKVVEGAVPDTDADKSFDMNITINGEQTDFSLKDGETKEFDAVVGDIFEVTEKDYTSDGYYQQISNGFGSVLSDTYVTVTNTYQREIRKEIQVEKEWKLNGVSEEVLPEYIIVQLKRGDTVVEEKKVVPDEKGQWKVTFDAPKYDEDGREIDYSIEELPVDGFSTTYDTSRKEEGIFIIVNTHLAPYQAWLPVIEKQVIGEDASATRFEFWLCGKDGAPMPEGAVGQTKIVSIDRSGQIDLGSITYTEAGEYHYTLTEVNGKEEGWTYDQREYELVMTVYEKDGNLTSYFNIYLDGKLTEHILFQNTYENPENPIPPEEPKEDPEDPKDDPETPKDDSEEPKEESGTEIVLPDNTDSDASEEVTQTGDPVSMTRYVVLMLLSLAVVLEILYQRGRQKRI